MNGESITSKYWPDFNRSRDDFKVHINSKKKGNLGRAYEQELLTLESFTWIHQTLRQITLIINSQIIVNPNMKTKHVF